MTTIIGKYRAHAEISTHYPKEFIESHTLIVEAPSFQEAKDKIYKIVYDLHNPTTHDISISIEEIKMSIVTDDEPEVEYL